MPKKAFITGINGFTGSHMAELLVKNKVKVCGIVRDLKKTDNLKTFRSKIRLWQFDLTQNPDKLQKILFEFCPDFIFHFASPLLRSPIMDGKILRKNLQVDFSGTIKLLEAVLKLKKKPKILVTGTNAVYQIKNNKSLKENTPFGPTCPYGLSKFVQETSAFAFCRKNKIPLIYTRTFHLIGPGQRLGFVVPDIAKQITEIEKDIKKPIIYVGNIKSKRDFTDVRDAVLAYWLIINKGKNYEIYNVCSGKSHSVEEIINSFLLERRTKIGDSCLRRNDKEECRNDIRIIQKKEKFRKGEILNIVGNNQKIKNLGWQAKIPFEKSLADTLSNFNKII